MENEILEEYKSKGKLIHQRLNEFRSLNSQDYIKEFLFCMLTPQSNAKKCWSAVEQLNLKRELNYEEIAEILRTRTRFHNNKARYILEGIKTWNTVSPLLNEEDKISLRNKIAKTVKGYGLKEASHFLRNIGKSENKIAILDRHILRNLKALGVIDTDKIKGKNHYLELEQKFLNYSKKIGIPIDELDLLFWSRENGEIFK